MRTLPNRFAARFLPRGWRDLLHQLLLFCGAYWLYLIVRGMTDGRVAEAFGNARELIGLERALGLFVEPAVHAWASGTDWVIDGASWLYVNTHFAITTLTLAFIYQHVHRRDGDRARALRRLPDGAAALHARVGLHGLGRALHRADGRGIVRQRAL
jgi:hypothetical protein